MRLYSRITHSRTFVSELTVMVSQICLNWNTKWRAKSNELGQRDWDWRNMWKGNMFCKTAYWRDLCSTEWKVMFAVSTALEDLCHCCSDRMRLMLHELMDTLVKLCLAECLLPKSLLWSWWVIFATSKEYSSLKWINIVIVCDPRHYVDLFKFSDN